MPAPRSTWKGFIKLSLVSVPVRAYTAHETSEDIRLNQLHKDCNSRVRYQKVCPEHGELKTSDIVKGYEYAKDQYVIIEDDELSKIRAQSERSIGIEGFVKADQIDELYHAGKTYYLLPDGGPGGKPYALLHRGMLDAGVHALAQIVVGGREQLVRLRPLDKLLSMTVLHHKKEMKQASLFEDELEAQKLKKEELELTRTLIDASTIENFDLAAYQDQYVAQLNRLIHMKIEGQEIVTAPDVEEPKIINLMDALKKSVAEAQAARKMAPSVEEPGEQKADKKSTRRKKTG
jgi:DNA end-binding protein Ku